MTIMICKTLTAPLMFPDNVVGECADCGCAVQHRPHAPPDCVLRCTDCFAEEVAKEGKPVKVDMTDETKRELGAIKRKLMS